MVRWVNLGWVGGGERLGGGYVAGDVLWGRAPHTWIKICNRSNLIFNDLAKSGPGRLLCLPRISQLITLTASIIPSASASLTLQ